MTLEDGMQILIALMSGGGLVGLLTLLFEYRKSKSSIKSKDVDDRISFWENVAKISDQRLKALEQKQDVYDDAIRTLETHISVLEHLIIRSDPDIELPPRPPINLSIHQSQS